MSTHIEINGIAVQVYESVFEYASRNASFSDYEDEKVDVSYFSEENRASKFPKVFVRLILLYKDLNFSVGKQVFDDVEFPEILEIDGSEYELVNFGEHEISYLKADVVDKPVYTLIYRTVQVTEGMYRYVYPFTEIFETEEAAQEKANEMNTHKAMSDFHRCLKWMPKELMISLKKMFGLGVFLHSYYEIFISCRLRNLFSPYFYCIFEI